jgi:BlaI family transcriptional regulator, penicillinase repressor
MGDKDLPSLGELEVQVLRLVWQNAPCTERQVTDLVRQERAVGRTTVLKTLQRLQAKGFLAREPGDGPVRYVATKAEKPVQRSLIRRFIDGFLGGSSEPLVAYLADSEKLSAKDLKTLRALADKLRKDEKS